MAIYNAIMAFTNWMWTFPILALLIGGGLVITVACDFVQIKHFGYMLKATFGDVAHSKSEEIRSEPATSSVSEVRSR